MVDKMKKTSIFRLKYILLCKKKWKEIPFKKTVFFYVYYQRLENFWVKEICDMDKGQGVMYT